MSGPSQPYTETFLRVAGLGTHSWTVPAGKRAIVTNVTAMNFAGAGAASSCQVAGLYVCYLPFQAQNEFKLWTGKAVAYAGQVIAVGITVAGIHTTVSGYLFGDPTGASGPGGRVERSPLLEVETVPR